MEKRKMTKAEAFEYLKCTKVFCGDSPHEVQRKIFETGAEWACGGNSLSVAPYLFVSIDGRLTICFDDNCFKNHDYRELSVDDILSIEIVEDKFSYDKVVELAKPLMHYLNEVECQDSICVNQLGIIHEPMSTLIFNNEIGE